MKRIVFIILIAAFILAACGLAMRAAPAATEAPARLAQDYGAPAGIAPMEPFGLSAATAAPPALAAEAESKAQGGVGGGGTTVERLVIQNADLSIVVKDVKAHMKAVEELARQMGGYVVSSNLYQTYTKSNTVVPEATVVIRVPAEKLDEALKKIKEETVEVQSETRSGQDVTAEYVDLQSRLKNLEAAEAKLTEIMDKAEKTEDVINVFNQLVYYREQIELVKGQMKYYEEAAALSAISVRLIAQETIQPIKIGPWTPQGAYAEAVQDLVYFLQDFGDFLIRFFIYNLPVLILIGIPLYLVFLAVRAIYRRTRKPKAALTEEPKK